MIRKSIVALIVLVSSLFAQDNYVFGPSIMVNDDEPGTRWHSTSQRSIACRGDTVYVVWRDDRYGNPCIFFSKSTDAGKEWTPSLLVSQNLDTLSCFLPHLSIDDLGNLYVAYCTKNENTANRDIYFTKSTNGGISFYEPVMANDSAVVKWQTMCACAVDYFGQNVYVVWEDSRNGLDADIYLVHSTDGGLTFLPSVRVNDGIPGDQWVPVIACDNSGQYVYSAWMDFRDAVHGAGVYFCRSDDYGETFGINYRINDSLSTSGWPSLYDNNGIIYCAWRDSREGGSIYFAYSNDNGLSFGANTSVRDDTVGVGLNPSIIAEDSDRVYIVWCDTRTLGTTGYDIYLSFSADGGASFQPNVRVNDLLGIVDAWDEWPAVAVNHEGRVFVAWSSDRNQILCYDIYCATGSYVGIQEYFKPIPTATLICQPNPFEERIDIRWGAADGGSRVTDNGLQLKIYDISGKLVKSFNHLTSSQQTAYRIIWDGRNDYGLVVPAGIYFCSVDFFGKKVVGKIVKIGR